MAVLDNRDPALVLGLIAAPPALIRADSPALDLEHRDFSHMPFELILVHGRDDPIIPSRPRAKAKVAPADKVSPSLVDRLAHVELGSAGVSTASSCGRRSIASWPSATSHPLLTWNAACRSRAASLRAAVGTREEHYSFAPGWLEAESPGAGTCMSVQNIQKVVFAPETDPEAAAAAAEAGLRYVTDSMPGITCRRAGKQLLPTAIRKGA